MRHNFQFYQKGKIKPCLVAVVIPLTLKGTENALHLPCTEKTCPKMIAIPETVSFDGARHSGGVFFILY